MTNDYQFSQSSLELLNLCISAASQRGTKWIELFKPDKKEIVIKQENISFSEDDTILIPSPSNVDVVTDLEEKLTRQSELDQVDKIVSILNAAPSNKLNFLVKQYNYEHFLPALAEKLTAQCIERICEDIFSYPDKSLHRNMKILMIFLPIYIKQETSSASLNLLVRAYKAYPDTVMALVLESFFTTDIPSKLLQEFFMAIDEKTRSQFLLSLSNKKLPSEVFVHHINTINFLFKNSQKTYEIQNFLLNGLLTSAQLCQEDKDYGRCLLTFFQNLNENTHISKQTLVKLLDGHKTTFNRPCQTILSNLYKSKD